MKTGIYLIVQCEAAAKPAFQIEVLIDNVSTEPRFAIKMEKGEWETGLAYLSGNNHGVTLQTKIGMSGSRRHVFFLAGPGQWDHVDDHGSLLPLKTGSQIIGEIHQHVLSQQNKSSVAA